jgi:hypothetical protein
VESRKTKVEFDLSTLPLACFDRLSMTYSSKRKGRNTRSLALQSQSSG